MTDTASSSLSQAPLSGISNLPAMPNVGLDRAERLGCLRHDYCRDVTSFAVRVKQDIVAQRAVVIRAATSRVAGAATAIEHLAVALLLWEECCADSR